MLQDEYCVNVSLGFDNLRVSWNDCTSGYAHNSTLFDILGCVSSSAASCAARDVFPTDFKPLLLLTQEPLSPGHDGKLQPQLEAMHREVS